MYSNPRAVTGMSRIRCLRQILNRIRKVNNMHAPDECIVNVSAASKIVMPWGYRQQQSIRLLNFLFLNCWKGLKIGFLVYFSFFSSIMSIHPSARKIADFSKLGRGGGNSSPPPPSHTPMCLSLDMRSFLEQNHRNVYRNLLHIFELNCFHTWLWVSKAW